MFVRQSWPLCPIAGVKVRLPADWVLSLAIKSARNPRNSVESVSSVVYPFGRISWQAPNRSRMTPIRRNCADKRH